MLSKFAKAPKFIKTGSAGLLENEFFTFSGLNLVDPDEISDNNESPYAVNFRIFAPKDNTKRVAISKRLGYTKYSIPVGETVDTSQTSTTGAADQSVTLTSWLAMPFTASTASRLSKVELNLKNTSSGTGPLVVAIYSDSSGPNALLASSSIPNSSIGSSYGYIEARFINAPLLATSTTYWIVAYIQNDGTNNYKWSSTTSVSTAKTSTNSGLSWSSASFGLNFKIYLSTDGAVKGLHRYYSSTASPLQLFAFGTNLYSVNDSTGAITSVKSGLSANAVYYDFSTVNSKEYYVNGVDAPRVYNGTIDSATGGSPPISTNIELHANREFYLSATDPNKLVFSEAGDYENFLAVNFIYVPSPNTSDTVQKIIAYNNTLVCFTRNRKYVLFGTDLTSFQLRESPAKKGTASPYAVASDGNFIYFLSDDGLYKYNGGTDILLSKKVQPILDNMASKRDVKLTISDNKVYLYYRPSGQNAKQNALIFDITYNTMIHDTNINIEDATTWQSQSDTRTLVTGSSLMGQLMYGEMGTSDLGKGIAFEYRTKYFSFGHPAAQHRIKRLYPQFRGQSSNYNVDVQIDVDEVNAPVSNLVPLGSGGTLWGAGFLWGSGLTWGVTNLPLTRLSVGGSNRKHQIRVVQGGIDNPVDFLGLTMYIKQQRPV